MEPPGCQENCHKHDRQTIQARGSSHLSCREKVGYKTRHLVQNTEPRWYAALQILFWKRVKTTCSLKSQWENTSVNSRKTEIPRNEKEKNPKHQITWVTALSCICIYTYHCKTAMYFEFSPNPKHMNCNIYCGFCCLKDAALVLKHKPVKPWEHVHPTAEQHGLSPWMLHVRNIGSTMLQCGEKIYILYLYIYYCHIPFTNSA